MAESLFSLDKCIEVARRVTHDDTEFNSLKERLTHLHISTVKHPTHKHIKRRVPREFHPFPKLLPELRLIIWEMALPRIFTVTSKYAHKPKVEAGDPRIPPLLHTCHESRIIAQKHYSIHTLSNLFDNVPSHPNIVQQRVPNQSQDEAYTNYPTDTLLWFYYQKECDDYRHFTHPYHSRELYSELKVQRLIISIQYLNMILSNQSFIYRFLRNGGICRVLTILDKDRDGVLKNKGQIGRLTFVPVPCCFKEFSLRGKVGRNGRMGREVCEKLWEWLDRRGGKNRVGDIGPNWPLPQINFCKVRLERE